MCIVAPTTTCGMDRGVEEKTRSWTGAAWRKGLLSEGGESALGSVASAAAGSGSRQRAVPAVGEVPGDRREEAESDEQAGRVWGAATRKLNVVVTLLAAPLDVQRSTAAFLT